MWNASEFSPYLFRKANCERIAVGKDRFVLGKHSGAVDYCINHNVAVSRMHAEILLKDGAYYIKDLGSTNKTYVNGVALPPEREIALFHDDEIRLANEMFTFNLI